MVKNTFGGKKSKSSARKHFSHDSHSGGSLPLPSNNFEIFAHVTKLLGNHMVLVKTTSGDLICHIRKKFKGPANTVTKDAFLLVGLRDFESTPKNCDLMDIYLPIHLSLLQNIPSFMQLFILLIDNNVSSHDDISFTHNSQQLIENTTTETENTTTEIDNEIDFDDI